MIQKQWITASRLTGSNIELKMRNQLRRRYSDPHGYSFVELLVVSAILLVLASAIAPLSSVTMQRQRETELRRSLRELRTAIDEYKDAVDLGLIAGIDIDVSNAGYEQNRCGDA